MNPLEDKLMVKTNEPGLATMSVVATWLTVKTNDVFCFFYIYIQGSGNQTRLMVVPVVPVQQQEGSIDYCRAHTMLPYMGPGKQSYMKRHDP